MSVEITFRKSLFGGFNRNDVLKYINSVAANNKDRQTVENQLANVEDQLTEAEEQIDDLSARVDNLNAEIERLKAQLAEKELELDSLKAAPVVEPVAIEKQDTVADKTADELMRESMAYADKYVASANLVASNIRKDTLEKAKEADARVAAMIERAAVFSKETESFEETLCFLKTHLEGVIKGFSE